MLLRLLQLRRQHQQSPAPACAAGTGAGAGAGAPSSRDAAAAAASSAGSTAARTTSLDRGRLSGVRGGLYACKPGLGSKILSGAVGRQLSLLLLGYH
jgi:hypothetical protein